MSKENGGRGFSSVLTAGDNKTTFGNDSNYRTTNSEQESVTDVDDVRTDKRVSSAGSSRFSLLSDGDSSFLPPSAMADLLEDEFLTPVAKSTQIHAETPGGRNTDSSLDGDSNANHILPPEGVLNSNRESDNLANISPGDQVKTKSSDLASAYAAMTNSKDLVNQKNQLLEAEMELLDDIGAKESEVDKREGDKTADSRTSAGMTDSRTHNEATDNITAADWSRGLAIRKSTGPVQVCVFSCYPQE